MATARSPAQLAGESNAGVPAGYYDGLVAKWPSAPAGTQRQRLDWINALLVTGAATPALIQGSVIYDMVDATEWSTLTVQNQSTVDRITGLARVNIAQQTRARRELNAIFPLATFPITRGALNTLYATFDAPQVPWWSAPQNTADLANGGGGLRTPVNANDLANAGLS